MLVVVAAGLIVGIGEVVGEGVAVLESLGEGEGDSVGEGRGVLLVLVLFSSSEEVVPPPPQALKTKVIYRHITLFIMAVTPQYGCSCRGSCIGSSPFGHGDH